MKIDSKSKVRSRLDGIGETGKNILKVCEEKNGK